MKRNQFLLLLLLATSFQAVGQVIRKDVNKTIQPQTQPQTITNPVNTIKTRQVITTSYDFSHVKICVDKSNNYDPGPRPVTTFKTIPRINSNGQIQQPSTVQQALTVDTRKMWPTGQTITIALAPNQVSNVVINKVKQYAKTWETIANVTFNFTDDWHNALVKVGFTKGGTWSWIGREVLHNPYGQQTMNFGWFDDTTRESEFSRVVTHEFGHVLGFIEENQGPGVNINWDAEKVYALFAKEGWSRADVDQKIFYKYTQASTNGTAYDRTSIMQAFFPDGLTTDNSTFPFNTTFSASDKEFARSVYPFPPTPANATGVLHTGDDCDAINFTVQYNVVPSNVIEFNLKPGIDNSGRPVSWWKQIGIPLKGGQEDRNLQLTTDGRTITVTKLVAEIDNTRGFSFAKAKMLGVHTGLGFTWNVWEGIPGGSRVTFVWQNDHCY